jgi:hypothetical protein
MSSVVIAGDTSGSITLQAPAVAGSTTLTLPTTSANIASDVNGTLYPLVSGTAVASTSGTSINFTGIPSWVKRITVMFSGVSTNGTSIIQVQLGDSGGIENTGYVAGTTSLGTSALGSTSFTTGFGIRSSNSAASTYQGSLVITNLSSNIWVANGCMYENSNYFSAPFGGSKTLSDVLDRIRITTVNGTDTFDAGSINILYE